MATPAENLRGGALMSASMAAFVVNDAFLKALSDELPLFQALFLRGLATTTLLAVLARALGLWRPRLPRQDLGLIGMRTLAEIAAAYLFLTALFHMPIANATAILQTMPLTLTLAGAVFLGEPVGWRRLTAIGVGFAGVLLIVKPGTEGFTVYSLYALASVVAVTTRDIVTRRMSTAAPSFMVALAGSAGVTAFSGAASLAGPWAMPSGLGWAQLAGSVAAVLCAYVLSVATMRVGELAAVTPFRYTALVWSLLIGVTVFGDWPDAVTLAGAGLIVATGLYTFYRERRLGRPVAAAPEPRRACPVDSPDDSL